jgi:polar amino acid transport system permease protein
MSDVTLVRSRPNLQVAAVEAVPVRHFGRWVGAAASLLVAVLVARLFILSPNIHWADVEKYLFSPQILAGVRLTIVFTVLSMALALVIGILMAVMRLSVNPVLSTLSWFYIWFFRGTPQLLQIILFFNIALVLPRVGIGIPWTGLWYSTDTVNVVTASVAAVLALGLNEGAYMAEIVRAGIQSVDFGQTDAALALGMKRRQAFRRIILPQAMRGIIPPTGNEVIGMLKFTSLVSVIAAQELLTKAQNISAGNFLIIELLIVAAFWYLLLTTLLMWAQYYIERHYARGATNRELPPTPLQRLRARFARASSAARQGAGR